MCLTRALEVSRASPLSLQLNLERVQCELLFGHRLNLVSDGVVDSVERVVGHSGEGWDHAKH
jgi:hypothetical protein